MPSPRFSPPPLVNRRPEAISPAVLDALFAALRPIAESPRERLPAGQMPLFLRCLRELARSRGEDRPGAFALRSRGDFWVALLALWEGVSPSEAGPLLDSFAECAQSRGFRLLLAREFRLDRLCSALGEPFCTPNLAVSIFVLLTAVLGDFSLPLSLSAPRFSPSLLAEGSRDPRFIESFSQVLLAAEARLAQPAGVSSVSGVSLEDFAGVSRVSRVSSVSSVSGVSLENFASGVGAAAAAAAERFFFACALRPSMRAARRVLARQIRALPPSPQSPRFVGYLSKLHACLAALMVETGKPEVAATAASLSLFLESGGFCGEA